jgi:hypothetical protein
VGGDDTGQTLARHNFLGLIVYGLPLPALSRVRAGGEMG